ncbi:hypothetical protein ABK040_008387 [Willaertia magna]
MKENDRLPSPQTLDEKHYKMIKVIGTGSFGKAILCEKDGKQYVMKRINMNELSKDEQQGALNEVQVLQKLKHEYIIAYYEYFQSKDGYLNIIMEYAEKGDIFTKIKNTNTFFPEEQIIIWFTQITLALKHVHDNNILHRDLKTQNIFLTKDNNIKLGDFGIAKILTSQTEFARTVIGTPYYLSPELCEDKPYNQKSDVWALGCVLYEISTKRHAFNGQNLPALILKILRGTYPPLPSFYSNNLKDLISSMLQKDPTLRPTLDEIVSLPFIQEVVTKLIITKQKVSSSVEQPKAKRDLKWVEEKQKELDSLYKKLHPSKQKAIDTVSKMQLQKHLEEKKEKGNERLKNRKEYYEQMLENKRKVSQQNQIIPPKAPVALPVKELKKDIPKIPVDPSPRGPPIQKPSAVDISEIINKQHVIPKNKAIVNAKENRSSEDERLKEKKKKDDERQKWLKNVVGSESEEKKKKFLEEKKNEKQRKKEEEKKKMLDHMKKMKEIKRRPNKMKALIAGEQEDPEEPIPIESKKTEKKEEKLNDKRKEEEEEKERKRKEQIEKQRQDFKDFIKNQKKKMNTKENVNVEIVVPGLQQQPSDILVVDNKKKQTSDPYLNRTIPEVELFVSKRNVEIKEVKTNEEVAKEIKEENDLDLLPSKEDRPITPMIDILNSDNIPKINIIPATQTFTSSQLSGNNKLSTPTRIITSESSPDLETLKKKQIELSMRIESLRKYCEHKFGETTFVELYRYLRDFELKDNEEEDNRLHKGVERILGSKIKLLPYVQRIYQLIDCEDLFYG